MEEHRPPTRWGAKMTLEQLVGLSGGCVAEDVEGRVEADADVCEWRCRRNG